MGVPPHYWSFKSRFTHSGRRGVVRFGNNPEFLAISWLSPDLFVSAIRTSRFAYLALTLLSWVAHPFLFIRFKLYSLFA